MHTSASLRVNPSSDVIFEPNTLGPILDGLMRNTSEARHFIKLAEQQGVAAVIAERDGPFNDYSAAPKDEQPDPSNVIVP